VEQAEVMLLMRVRNDSAAVVDGSILSIASVLHFQGHDSPVNAPNLNLIVRQTFIEPVMVDPVVVTSVDGFDRVNVSLSFHASPFPSPSAFDVAIWDSGLELGLYVVAGVEVLSYSGNDYFALSSHLNQSSNLPIATIGRIESGSTLELRVVLEATLLIETAGRTQTSFAVEYSTHPTGPDITLQGFVPSNIQLLFQGAAVGSSLRSSF